MPDVRIVVIIISLLLVIGYLLYQINKAKKQKKLMEIKLRDYDDFILSSKIKNIEAKLSPHLFKNILNSIQSHAYQTYYTIDKLAKVLDYILYDSNKEFVTPKEEVDFILNLIEINKIKLSPLFDIKVKLNINENEALYNQTLMLPLASVDIIENAFKHADLKLEDSFISITITFTDNKYTLTVANKISEKDPIKKIHGGIGEKTVEDRLTHIYGESFQLKKYREENVFIAQLKIDLLEYKAKMLAVGR